LRRHVFAGSLHEQRWNQDSRQKVAFVPVGPRTQSDAGGMPPHWNGSIIAALRLANNISPFLFWKADWHGLRIWDSYKVESVKTLQTSDTTMHRAFDVVSL
jgi:hypothetical protein